jgi:hypothetical protein
VAAADGSTIYEGRPTRGVSADSTTATDAGATGKDWEASYTKMIAWNINMKTYRPLEQNGSWRKRLHAGSECEIGNGILYIRQYNYYNMASVPSISLHQVILYQYLRLTRLK